MSRWLARLALLLILAIGVLVYLPEDHGVVWPLETHHVLPNLLLLMAYVCGGIGAVVGLAFLVIWLAGKAEL